MASSSSSTTVNSSYFRDTWDLLMCQKRKLRVGIRTNNGVLFVHLKLLNHKKSNEVLHLTLAELELLQQKATITAALETWSISNGRRRVDWSLLDVPHVVTLRQQKLNDQDEWFIQNEMELSREEFGLFTACIDDILKQANISEERHDMNHIPDFNPFIDDATIIDPMDVDES